jgi:hypothetical protein
MSDTEFTPPPGWPLEVAMQQRAEGLRIARSIVKTQAAFGGASIHTDVADLIKMAEYIVDGTHFQHGESQTQEATA